MNGSIRGQLAKALLFSGIISAFAILPFVAHHYGFLTIDPPPFWDVWPEIKEHVVLPVSIFLLTFGLCALWAVQRIVARLKAATRDAVLATQRLDSYTPKQGDVPTEVEPFAMALADLSQRLKLHAERQEAFASDAAHELKTPLAILALEFDSLPNEHSERLKARLTELSAMVDQLLLLAKSQSAQTLTVRSEIDLAHLGKDVAAQLAPVAVAQGRSLAFCDHGARPIRGLGEAVSAAIRTLTENALRAAPAKTEVVIEVGPGPTIAVLDDGAGIDAHTLETLKARGVRADRAPGGAAGLGLTIADRIIQAHGGVLETCLPERTGLRVSFVMPI